MKATVFRAASIERWKDALCLHKAGRFQGAIYLCGYALECELKFCVCAAQRKARLEESEAKRLGHGLAELLDAAGIRNRLYANDDLRVAFHNINSRWSTEIRYSGRASDEKTSASFLRDTQDLREWLQKQLRP